LSLSPGVRLGAYEIVALVGAGGMGEVYRAHDTKLGRSVAVKVLPEAFAADPERIVRFEREAKILASLNHPHIAALYGMEQDGGRHFLVMELVEGETLADRLRRGAIPVEDALTIAHSIVDALDGAHERGVVHRDLKPANVKITPDEKVKVLDFGLAKAMSDETAAAQGFSPAPTAATHSPTLSMMATQAGVILGTAAYMSPEQAKGLPADHRSDVFSFGCVLYEMLTERQPFRGDTVPEVMASVLVREVDLGALPPNLNPRLPDLLKRCLEKNPKRRWQSVADMRAEIEAIAAAPRALPAAHVIAAPPRPLWKRAVPVAAGAIAASIITGAVMWTLRPLAPPPVVTRFPVALAEGQQLSTAARNGVAISPDGTQIAYVADSQLYLRAMSELEGRPITGRDQGNVANPVFSPDGRSIAFYTPTGLAIRRVAVSGGAAVTITPTDGAPLGMSWGTDGIVFVGNSVKGVFRVAANGGKPELVAVVKDDEVAYGARMLPDRQHVLFTVAGGTTSDQWDKARIVVEALASHERKIVWEGGSDARYLPTGHIVYAAGGALFAIPFDVRRLEVSGGPTPVVEGIRRAVAGATGVAFFDVSDNGSLIYAPGPVSGSAAALDVALIDITTGIGTPLKLPPASYEFPRVSPDGKRIAVHVDDGKEANVWIHELSGVTSVRRLTNGGQNRFPVWSPDAQRVAFQSDREGDLGIFSQRADGSGTPSRLTKADKDTAHVPESWSPDGTLVFAVTKGFSHTLWTLGPQDNKAVAFGDAKSIFLPSASFSPDGRWVAYTVGISLNDVSVFVQPFPSNGSKYLITATGFHPFWSPDGKQLLYRWRGQTFAVSITTRPNFAFGNPTPVNGPYRERGPQFAREIDFTPDGKQVVGVVARGASPSATTSASQLQVVLNWFEELKARVPAK
jgi:eukaryotic-like serine/threonine-protein kinase